MLTANSRQKVTSLTCIFCRAALRGRPFVEPYGRGSDGDGIVDGALKSIVNTTSVVTPFCTLTSCFTRRGGDHSLPEPSPSIHTYPVVFLPSKSVRAHQPAPAESHLAQVHQPSPPSQTSSFP